MSHIRQVNGFEVIHRGGREVAFERSQHLARGRPQIAWWQKSRSTAAMRNVNQEFGSDGRSGSHDVMRPHHIPTGSVVRAKSLEFLARCDCNRDSEVFWKQMLVEANRHLEILDSDAGDFYSGLIGLLGDTVGDEHLDLRVRCGFQATMFLMYGGQVSLANRVANVVLNLAMRSGDLQAKRRAHNLSGLAALYVGNKTAAMRSFCTAWQIAVDSHDTVRAWWMAAHIGITLTNSGLFAESRQIVAQLNSKIHSMPDEDGMLLLGATANALALDVLEDLYAGRSAFVVDSSLLDRRWGVHDSVATTEHLCTLSRAVIVLGRHGEVPALLDRCAGVASHHLSPQVDINCKLIRGLLDVYQGNADVGISRLHASMTQIGDHYTRLVNGLWTLAQAYRRLGDIERGEHYRQRLAETLSADSDGLLQQYNAFIEKFDKC